MVFIIAIIIACIDLGKAIFHSLGNYKKLLTLLYVAIFYPILLCGISLLPFISTIDSLLNSIISGDSSSLIGEILIIGILSLIISLFINGFLELSAYFLHLDQWFIQMFGLQQSCCSAQMTIASFGALWVAATMDSFAQSSKANQLLLMISVSLFISSLFSSAYRYFVHSKNIIPNIYKTTIQYWNAYKD